MRYSEGTEASNRRRNMTTNNRKTRTVTDGLNQLVTLQGWNTKNDKLREVAEKMVGPTGSVRVRYWRGLDLVSDVSFDVATCGMRVDSESFK
jgi:hypothetical protein